MIYDVTSFLRSSILALLISNGYKCDTKGHELVLVRALELAQLDSNRAYINALARFLPSSARLESELAQLNSNSTLQLDELDRAFRAIQLVNIGAITE